MGRPCTICRHAKREEIEKLILDSTAGYRNVARRYGISTTALFRHRREHLPGLLAKGFSLSGTGTSSPVVSATPTSVPPLRSPPKRPNGTPPSSTPITKGLTGEAAAPFGVPVSPEDQHAIRLAEHQAGIENRQDQLAIDTVQQLRAINAACLEVLREARTNGQPLILLRAVDRIARQIELQAKLLGQIQEGTTVNVAVMPEWHGLRQTVLDALSPFPEARAAIANALRAGGF